MGNCRLLGILNDGLVRLITSDFSGDYGSQLWSRAKLRKTKDCFRCDHEIAIGSMVFSPITHGQNRMHRICTPCVERMKATHETP